jgi:hypothetical protein
MNCEKCGRETGIIKHIQIDSTVGMVFAFNQSRDAMVCVVCWNDAPKMPGVRVVDEIREG